MWKTIEQSYVWKQKGFIWIHHSRNTARGIVHLLGRGRPRPWRAWYDRAWWTPCTRNQKKKTEPMNEQNYRRREFRWRLIRRVPQVVREYSYRALLGPTDLRLEQRGLYRASRLTSDHWPASVSGLYFPTGLLLAPFFSDPLLLPGPGPCVSLPLGLRLSQVEVAHQSTESSVLPS